MNLSLALVRDNRDPEGLGRLKIALIGREASPEVWARVAAPFAGNGHGLFVLPDIGDEVLVGFLQDDARLPVVLGGLWNAMDPPPTADPRERLLRSTDGHKISLLDSADPGRRALLIEDAHGSRVEMRQGHMLIRAAGVLEIEGAEVTVNGRPLALGATEAPVPQPKRKLGKTPGRYRQP